MKLSQRVKPKKEGVRGNSSSLHSSPSLRSDYITWALRLTAFIQMLRTSQSQETIFKIARILEEIIKCRVPP
jgi:hypothetical protein